jgi:hypothetical protein
MISVSAADSKGMLEANQQQGRKVSEKVSDQTGATLPGVSVIVKGTSAGTITDNNGTLLITNSIRNMVFS